MRVYGSVGSSERRLTVEVHHRRLRDEHEIARTQLDASGHYALEVSVRSPSESDEPPLSLIVRAGYEDERLGFVLVASSDLVCAVSDEIEINLVVGDGPFRPPSELQKLRSSISPHLDDADLSAAELDRDDIDFLECSAGVDRVQLATLIVASRLAEETGLPDWLFYALGRQGIRLQLEAMIALRRQTLQNAMATAVRTNIVTEVDGESIGGLVAALQRLLVRASFLEPDDPTRVTPGALLATSLTGREAQEHFLRLYLERPESDTEFWELLERDGTLNEGELQDLRMTLWLGRLAQYNLPVLQRLSELRRSGDLQTLRDLASWDRDDWRRVVQTASRDEGVEAPPATADESPEDRIETFVSAIRAPIESLFPSDSLRASLGRASDTPSELRQFLENATRLDLYWSNIDAYLDDEGEDPFEGIDAARHEDLLEEVRRLQRLLRISPRADHVRALRAAGYSSAFDIATTSRREFIQRFEETVNEIHEVLDDVFVASPASVNGPGEDTPPPVLMMMNSTASPGMVADSVYSSASATTAYLQTAATDLQMVIMEGLAGASGSPDDIRQAKEEALKAFPNLEALFGEQSFCVCEHCQSVLSPAAYLVDLLQFLDGKNDPPLDALLARRPDLQHIVLSCENTHTPLPYVDLVNEILESFVSAHLDSNLEWSDAVPSGPLVRTFDTGDSTAQELRAVPQHVDDTAYEYLAKRAVYPLSLPFDRAFEVSRAYIAHLGTSRKEIAELFSGNGSTAQPPSILGHAPTQQDIILRKGPHADVWHYYGYGEELDTSTTPAAAFADDLASIPTFLRRSGLTHAELIALLKTEFINPYLFMEGAANRGAVISIELRDESKDWCDASQHRLSNLDWQPADAAPYHWLDRIHRFIRLWRGLGWTIEDVDRALSILSTSPQPVSADILDEAVLRKLSDTREVAERLATPLEALLPFWGPIDTWNLETSLYSRLFLDRALAGSSRTDMDFRAIALGQDSAPSNPSTAPLQEPFASVVGAALSVTLDDLELIRKDAEGNGQLGLDLLTLESLSVFYRYATLAKALGLPVRDLISLLGLVQTTAELDPFGEGDPGGTLRFVGFVEEALASGASVPFLNYLVRGEVQPGRHPHPTRALIQAVVTRVRDAVRSVQEQTATPGVQSALALRQALERAAVLLDLAVPGQSVADPDLIDRALWVLDPRVEAIMGEPLSTPQRSSFVAEHFSKFLDLGEADPALFGGSFPAPPGLDANRENSERFEQNVDYVLAGLLPFLRRRLQTVAVTRELADATGTDSATMEWLLQRGLSSPTVDSAPAVDMFIELGEAGEGTSLDPGDLAHPVVATLHRVFQATTLVGLLDLVPAELAFFFPVGSADPEIGLDDLPIQPISATDPLVATLLRSWRTLTRYVKLRDQLPRGENTLIDFFVETNAAQRQTLLRDLLNLTEMEWTDLIAAGAEDPTAAFPGGTPAQREELVAAVDRLRRAALVQSRVGVPAARLAAWAKAPSNFGDAVKQAEEIIGAVAAQYERPRWLDVAESLNDALREKQREALTEVLLPRLGDQTDPASGFDFLGHFLIDVEMSSCMLTSRIKQAISSIQLFIQRCLLDLERDVSPDRIDTEQWEWMRNYRIWEANRKVLLYPENWIEPELRDDKTPFFRELEAELLQSELSEEAIERAVTNYVYKLDEVARLDIRGFCRESDDDNEVYHVFGRTWNPPHKYFYRRGTFKKKANVEGEWSAWERVDLDIEGDHLMPVVSSGRLMLLWPLFEAVPLDVKQAEGEEPKTKWSIGMRWSEKKHGSWSPPMSLEQPLTLGNASADGPMDLGSYSFRIEVSGDVVKVWVLRDWMDWYSAGESAVQGPMISWADHLGTIEIGPCMGATSGAGSDHALPMVVPANSRPHLMGYRDVPPHIPNNPNPIVVTHLTLNLSDGATLVAEYPLLLGGNHSLLPPNEKGAVAWTELHPFFFRDPTFSGFARPVHISYQTPQTEMPAQGSGVSVAQDPPIEFASLLVRGADPVGALSSLEILIDP